MRRLAVLVVLAGAWLALPAAADAARVAVGISPRADSRSVADAIERRTGTRPESLKPIPALLVDLPEGVSLKGIRGIRYVEPLVTRRLAFTPSDPLVSKQWYLGFSGFYAPWITLPSFEPIPVAVIDSGVDKSHPDLAGKILDAETFVGGSAKTDELGHGTFVAGLIGAGVDNGIGIAGLAPSAQLLVAKVVTKSRAIPVEAEAKAIRWAVDNGARVINMSLGGIRDPLDPDRDTYSRLEADAVAYAISNGVVVVAAVGNSDQAPTSPWKYASYPAALPHVLGVSAMSESGAIPTFSNRDRIYNDIAAPGLRILSALPRSLTSRYPSCSDQGYSICGPEEYREAQGTSFAAPQVSAAAAVLLSLRPTLRPEQVTQLLLATAVDLEFSTGCSACGVGRDAYSGRGRLDVATAIGSLNKPLPERDFYETNDDLGSRAYTTFGSNRRIQATVDYWDDQDDVYAISLGRNQPVYVGLTGADTTVDVSLAFWLPKAQSLERVVDARYRVRTSARRGSRQYLSYRPRGRRHVLRAGPHVEPGRDPLPARHRQGLAVQQLVVRHVAQNACRVADHDRAWRDVFRDDRARADERLLADLDARAQDRASADARAAPDRRPRDELVAPLGAAHEVVVRRHDAGSDEDVVLERGVGGDVRLRLDLGQRAHRRVVLDQRAAAEHHVVADRDSLADARLVAEDHARADPRTGEDDRSGGHDRPLPDLGRRERLALRGGARRERRLLPHDGVLEHLDAFAQHRPRVHRRRRVDVSCHRARSSACRAPVRLVRRPRRPSVCRLRRTPGGGTPDTRA